MKKTRRARSERAGRTDSKRGGEASRDSSVSSSEVRCACQYFQSDSLLPERTALVLASRPSSRASGGAPAMAAAAQGDHEYEPISPPPDVRMDVEAESRRRRSSSEALASSLDSHERRYLKTTLEDTAPVPGDGDLEDAAMAGRELGDTTNNGDDMEDDEGPVGAAELQARLEERFLNETPTTTESRTDGEFNTSNVDSSALEDLPLQKEARRKKQQEEDSQKSQPSNFQQRIRSQAGKLRTRLRNIKKPMFSMPERPKITLPDRPKFHLPERPKFTMPERPKFNLPQRPKFSLPERPKFTMPERPKFTMPERPKFNLPQRPKISMPTLSSLSSKTKGRSVFSSTRRPLRDRSANVSTVSTTSSKKKMFDFDFRTYPRLFDRKSRSKPKGQRAETPPPTTPFRKKGPVGHRWLHRFKDITYADEDVAMPSSSDGTRVAFESQESGEQVEPEEYVWEDKERKSLNEDVGNAGIQRQDSGQTESITEFKDKDLGYAVSEPGPLGAARQQMASSGSFPESDQEQRSSGSSSDRHRAGVLEEIDSDEFFLRQKGISQEDVVLGRMLTSEIRDAFRSPASALKQMDSSYEYYDDENEVDNLANQYRGTPEREPMRPARTRSLRPRKRSSKSKESSPTEEPTSPIYNTFPPTRPKRSRAGRKQDGVAEGMVEGGVESVVDSAFEGEQRPATNEEVEVEGEEIRGVIAVQEEILQGTSRPELQKEISEEIEETSRDELIEDSLEGEVIETRGKEESPSHPEIVITDAHDEEMFDQQFPEEEQVDRFSQKWRYENEVVDEAPPTAPRRKKRTLKQSLPDSLCNGSYTKEDWMENVNGHITPDEIIALRMESEYIIPDVPDGEEFELPPTAPKRIRRKSKSSRGPSLMEDEDRTSHAASSLPAEEAPPVIDIGDMGGYASVVKPVPVKPERPKKPKPSRPPPPGRRKKSNGSKFSHFFSLPRKPPPLRPVRNYSTLGPSRPPRRERFAESRYIDQDNQIEPYIEIEGDEESHTQQEESHDSSRDLQSGDIIEKMKGRPLPPPPRPPRKSKEGRDTLSQFDEDEALQVADMHDDQEDIAALAALKDDVFYSHKSSFSSLQHDKLKVERNEGVSTAQQTSLDPEEISVYTQTDPLLEEYCEDLVEGEPLKEHVGPVEVVKHEIPPRKEVKPEESMLQTKAISSPPADQWTNDEEVIESSVLGRLVCRSEASPESTLVEKETRKSPVVDKPQSPPKEIRTHTIIERHVPVQVGPDENTEVELLRAQRLQVSELDVERLNVGELQAQKILVSDIDGVSMQVAELTSKSGNLVVSGIELPSGFVQELYDARPTPPTHIILECSSTQTTAPPEESQPASAAPAAGETQRQERSQPLPTQQSSAHEGSPAVQVQAPAFSTGPAQSYVHPHFGLLSSGSLPMQSGHPPPGMHFVSMGHNGSYAPSQETYQPFVHEYTPPVPPPPRMSSRQRSHISAARELESEDEVVGVVPPATPSSRRRRHHAAAKPVSRYSSDDDDEEEEGYAAPPTTQQYHPPGRRHATKAAAAEASAGEMGRQLVQLMESTAGRWLRRAWSVISPDTEERRRDLQTALCALLVLVAVLILLGFGSGKTFHHHHWDYYFPPPL